ncbi:ABC transporter permease [Conexibacter woesei]|uniref:Binding-protein-dependent transport systems inner membrane component n=1 Tax=Conexibacter woesei (strain DSM 14684 / CCUG 47730 / CIP 108061 / JCM 11494 / NBRC 100937 / ID131577) TaxID=469383 RepID=D3FAQ4_CONWI|nr:ABC transporter permease [Conexibacter woesei]ADB51217.1 binding-protein-dependent transport systems inner membrane component [Conexibacter woesei DSM 14684]
MSAAALDTIAPAAPARRRWTGAGWLVRRFGISLLTIALASVLVFASARALPGDPALTMAGAGAGRPTPAMLEQARERYGLDASLPVQYLRYVERAIQGDLGTSASSDLPVARMIGERLPVTLQLAVMSMLLAVTIGVGAGVLAALFRGRAADYAVTAIGLLGISLPNFWLGLMLVLLFAVNLGWLPASGFTPFMEDPVANLRDMILPVWMLGTMMAAVLLRQMRSSMVDALQSDYVRTARSKGLPPYRVVVGHALRNCMIPLLTLTGLQLGALISGAVVAEHLFVLPGLGTLLLDGVHARDYAVVQAVALVMAVGYVLINFAVDVLYSVADPRVGAAGDPS